MQGLFVPLMYQATYYLSTAAAHQQAAYTLGKDRDIRISGRDGEAPYRIITPEGTEVIPEQRALFGITHIQLGGMLDRPGFFDIMHGDQLVRRVAFNLKTAESDLNTLPADEASAQLEEALGRSVTVLDPQAAGRAEGLVQAIRQQRFGMELWNVFLAFALACLVGEMVIASRWPAKQPAAA